jgi:hypothetical protein
MTIRRKQATFHQSIRHFRPGSLVLMRNSTDEQTTRWRTDVRLMEILPDEATRRFAHQKRISTPDVAQSGAEAQAASIKTNRTFDSTSNFRHGHGTPPKGHVPHPVNSTDNINESPSAMLVLPPQQYIRAHDNTPAGQNKPIDIANHGPDIRSSIDGPARPTVTNLVTPRTRRLNVEAALHGSPPTTALPAPVAARAVRERSVKDIAVRPDLPSERTSAPSVLDRGRHSGANVPKPRKAFGAKIPDTSKDIPATAGDYLQPFSNPVAAGPRIKGPDGLPRGENKFDSNEDGSSRQPESSNSVNQSSNLIGELWLDTLSLREWLQTYLAGEMGHALQAASRFGTSVE